MSYTLSHPANAIESPGWSLEADRQLRLVHVLERSQWESLARQFRDYDYRQTWNYGLASADRYNAKIDHVAIKVGSELLGMASIRLKSIPLLKTGMAYVGGGPITKSGDKTDLRALDLCLSALREEYLDHRGYTLRILPPMNPDGDNRAINDVYKANGFGDSAWPPPHRTIMLNIDRPAADIRKALAQKWRNCLNNSERQGLTIQIGSQPEMFQQFRELFDPFLDRKQIQVSVGADFYSDVQARSEDNEGYVIALACKEGVPVAGHLLSILGDVGVSVLAATSSDGLKLKAANFVQWHVILECQRRGMRWYDSGGVEPEKNPGLYHFKSGLNGIDVLEPGPFQASPGTVVGSVTPAVERLYRWSKRCVLRS